MLKISNTQTPASPASLPPMKRPRAVPAMRVPHVGPTLIALVLVVATLRLLAAIAQVDVAGLVAEALK